MTATTRRVSTSGTCAALAGGLLLALAGVGVASAQTMSANSASYNAGYGRTPDQENHPVQFDTLDANGNQMIINGPIM